MQPPPPQIQQPTFVNQSGNILVPISGQPGPTAMLLAQPGDQLIQVLPGGPTNSTVVAAPVCSSAPVMLPQYQFPSDMPRILHPPPMIATQPIQTPLMMSINVPPCHPPPPPPLPPPPAPAVIVSAPSVPFSPPPAPPPPPPPPPAQVLVAHPSIVPLQQPMVPLQPNQPHATGSMIPVFNQVPMIAVDVPSIPCSPIALPVDQNASAVASSQRTGVRPLMDIKVEINDGCIVSWP